MAKKKQITKTKIFKELLKAKGFKEIDTNFYSKDLKFREALNLYKKDPDRLFFVENSKSMRLEINLEKSLAYFCTRREFAEDCQNEDFNKVIAWVKTLIPIRIGGKSPSAVYELLTSFKEDFEKDLAEAKKHLKRVDKTIYLNWLKKEFPEYYEYLVE